MAGGCVGRSFPEIKTYGARLLHSISDDLVVDDVIVSSNSTSVDVRWYHSAGGSGYRHTTNVRVGALP